MAAFTSTPKVRSRSAPRHRDWDQSPAECDWKDCEAGGDERSTGHSTMLEKTQDFFQICDIEDKGFITHRDMQRLHGQLPLSAEELENVFDTLDSDGNGYLTLQEFSSGFSEFLFGRRISVTEGMGEASPIAKEANQGPPDSLYQTQWEERLMGSEDEEERHFCMLMESLGASNVFEDPGEMRSLWAQLRRDEPHLLSNFEEFLARVTFQIKEANQEKREMESALKRKAATHDDEIQRLYEEMEQQIKNEKDRILLQDSERFLSRSQDLEHQLSSKERELEQIFQKQRRLECQCRELHSEQHMTKVENVKLKQTNEDLAQELEHTSQELSLAQDQLGLLQEQSSRLHKEREREMYQVTEGLQRERASLLKQLDLLREMNKHLRDERDMSSYQKLRNTVENPAWNPRPGSNTLNPFDKKAFKCEEEVVLPHSKKKSPGEVNGYSLEDVVASKPPHIPLQRIISIEEDHLPQLLQDDYHAQLCEWSEEAEEDGEEEEHIELQMNSIYPPSSLPTREQQPADTRESETPTSPRGQPVGKETVVVSDYQRVRVENVCVRLGLQPLAYLWRRDQATLLSEMISCDLHALLIKVAAFGLDPEKHLGKSLADMEPYLTQLSEKYGVHVCGEGGEYETFTLDCPLFKKRLVIDAMETVIHSADAFAPVGYLHFSMMHTEDKVNGPVASALPLGSCPCQSVIEKMTEEADQAEDIQEEFTSNGDLSCHRGRDFPSCSPKSSRGYQWISGITGLQSPDPGIQSQTNTAFTLLQAELERRGWQLKHIVLVHLYVRNMEDFISLNKVYTTHFGANPPARVCVQAPLPAGQLLQMDCLLHDWPPEPQEAQQEATFHHREALHVQSLSHWAPANIGPYSQALRVDEAVFCAGQIALVPCTMQLVRAGARTQACLSFSHIEKVLEAVISSLTLGHVLQAHCYATRSQDIPVIRAVWDSKLRAAQEKEESFGEQEIQSGPLVVTVVPALPRGAAVELHVIAAHDDPRHRTSCHMTTEVACGTIECHAMLSSDSQCATVSLALMVPSSAPAVSGVEGEILVALVATLQSAMQKIGGGGISPLCARVFYKCNNALAGQLVTGLEECLRTTLGQASPSVAFAPVLDLPDSAVLHLSCWLSL